MSGAVYPLTLFIIWVLFVEMPFMCWAIMPDWSVHRKGQCQHMVLCYVSLHIITDTRLWRI